MSETEKKPLQHQKFEICELLESFDFLLHVPKAVLAIIAEYASGLQFVYSSDFDTNGILFWIGCDEGTKGQWSNPHLSKAVTVTASRVDARSLDNMVGRHGQDSYDSSNFNDRYTVDFGLRYTIVPTHYTLRRGYSNSDSIPKHFEFLGSLDAQIWVCLGIHAGDDHLGDSMGVSYPTHTWPVLVNTEPTDDKSKHKAWRWTKLTATSTEAAQKIRAPKRKRHLNSNSGSVEGKDEEPSEDDASGAWEARETRGSAFRYLRIIQKKMSGKSVYGNLSLSGLEVYGTLYVDGSVPPPFAPKEISTEG